MEKYPEHLREPLEVTRQRNLTSNEAALELMMQNDHHNALNILNKTIESEMALAAAADASKVMRNSRASSGRKSGGGGTAKKNLNAKSKNSSTIELDQLEQKESNMEQRALAIVDRTVGYEEEETSDFQMTNTALQATTALSTSTAATAVGVVMKSNDLSTYGVDIRFLINRGDCHRALGNLSAALHDFNAALEVNRDNWDLKTRISLVHYQCGVHYFNMGKYNESKHALTSAIELNSRVALYHAARGETHYQLQMFSGAYDDFKRALELDPNLTHILERYRQLEPHMTTLKLVSMKRDPKLPFGNISGGGGARSMGLEESVDGLVISNRGQQHKAKNSVFIDNSNNNNQSDFLSGVVGEKKKEKFNNGQDKIMYASTNYEMQHSHHMITFPMVSPAKQRRRSNGGGGKVDGSRKKRNGKRTSSSPGTEVGGRGRGGGGTPPVHSSSSRISDQSESLNLDEKTGESEDGGGGGVSSKSSPIRDNSKKWIKFKADAKNSEVGPGRDQNRSYTSKAVREGGDSEMKFVWKATETIQTEEDLKREMFRMKLQEQQGSPTQQSTLPKLFPGISSGSLDNNTSPSSRSSTSRVSLFSKSSSRHNANTSSNTYINRQTSGGGGGGGSASSVRSSRSAQSASSLGFLINSQNHHGDNDGDRSLSRGRGVSKDLVQFAEMSNYQYRAAMSREKAQMVSDMQQKALGSMMDHLDSPGLPSKLFI
jgi:tetratricopeptide (TPR) repeat protein